MAGRPPPLVERMPRIRRQAVVAGGQAIASLVDGPHALMAIPTEGAQRAELELVVIAAVPWMMIGDRRSGEATLFLAQGAQWLDLQLVLGPRSPALQRVPTSPVERLGGCEVASGHRVRR
jgi:hypothetical protein